MDSKELKQEIETRLQFVIALAIFFPTLISAFLDTSQMEKKQIISISLKWTGIVGPFLFVYVFFALFKNKLPRKLLGFINYIILATIFLFIFPSILMSTSQLDRTSTVLNYISFHSLPLMPYAVLGALFFGVSIYYIKTETGVRLPKFLLWLF